MSPSPARHRGDETDEDLAAAAGRGDREALDLLLRRHQERVYRLCRRMCGNEADALDATQEALITLARRVDRFDGRSAFSTWLYRVATNACLDELRRRRRRPVTGHDDDVAAFRHETHGGHDHSAEDPGEIVTRGADIDEALGQLRPEFRAVVVLRDVAGLDYAEIADVLELAPGTVRSRIARGRGHLARLLANPTTAGEPGPEASASNLPRDQGPPPPRSPRPTGPRP